MSSIPKSKPIKPTFAKNQIDRILKIIQLSIENEAAEASKYKYMYETTDIEYDKEILKSMYFDELKHKVLLNELYVSLSKSSPPDVTPPVNHIMPGKTQYGTNVLDEIESARLYNEIMTMLNKTKDISIIRSLINDEQNHAILNLYLLNKTE